jgi:hypothetical protein
MERLTPNQALALQVIFNELGIEMESVTIKNTEF